jgi:DNA binding domain, excisionase family
MNEYLKDYPPVLTVRDVSKILGVTEKTVRILVGEGALFGKRVGNRIRIPKDKLIAYIENEE